jgi:hypothetical protein
MSTITTARPLVRCPIDYLLLPAFVLGIINAVALSLPEGLGVAIAPDSPWPVLRWLHTWAVEQEPQHLAAKALASSVGVHVDPDAGDVQVVPHRQLHHALRDYASVDVAEEAGRSLAVPALLEIDPGHVDGWRVHPGRVMRRGVEQQLVTCKHARLVVEAQLTNVHAVSMAV